MKRYRSEVEIATMLRLWGLRSIKYPGWHAVIEFGQGHLTCLFEPDSDPGSLIADAKKENVRIITKYFEIFALDSLVATGNESAGLRPGNGVFAYNKIDGPGRLGTLAGFLQLPNPAKKDPMWAFGCRHIMGEANRQSHPDQILDLDQNIVSSMVLSVPWSLNVDLSVAKVTCPASADPSYLGIQIDSPQPTVLVPDTKVQKIGFKTHVTSGIFLGYSLINDVLHTLTKEKIEFGKQLLIGSVNNQPFLDCGDSGSLVVSSGHPVGLLFAKTESHEPGSPFGLATPFDEVLARLSEIVPNTGNHPLQLLLKN